MKLGGNNGTGSLTNWLLSGVKGQPEPVVGMGATLLAYTDRYAGTITRVFEERGVLMVDVQEDDAKRTDNNGMSEMQEYAYSPNPNGRVKTFKLYKGGWQAVYKSQVTGRWKMDPGGNGLRIGERRKYNDFSF
jgi:hypothetical protein